MSFLCLSEAFGIQSEAIKTKIEQLQAELESFPDSFFALFWLYTHDFLYVSPSIEQVTGHPYPLFEKQGMVFFTSIIPPELIENIYQTMYSQAEKIQNHTDGIFADEFLHVKAAVFDTAKKRISVNYNAVLLDEKAFDPISYLVLCSWIDTRNKAEEDILLLENDIKNKLMEAKNYYFKANQARFQFLQNKNKISEREKEVALLLSQGYSTKNISDQLHISFNTVESHRKNLLQKLAAKNTAELVYKLNQV
ncbi:helix-turn-helix transcriptional regulator [Shivajiella indica]|uniref:Response regulator transcription factor n=1 Tax=Shivajiella indica TaxID=872115 RepID=A0ABW5B5R9_9BACT